METMYAQKSRPITQSHIALSLMINQLSVSTLPSAIRRSNVVMNEVPTELYISTDRQKLATILAGLLHMVISHSNNNCIHITASTRGRLLLLSLKGASHLGGHVFYHKLGELRKLSKAIGGNVSVMDDVNNETTISFSLMNQYKVA